MGASESTLAGLEGYQIVRVIGKSPAHNAGLVPFFDFITAVDKLALDRDDPAFFFDYVRRNKDRAITCQVFNLRVRATRDVTVVPSDCWGGVGLLGCNVCWESADNALESTYHIVEVARDSPAYHADLMAHRDYIIGMQPAGDGSTITTFRDGNDFHSRVEEWRARMAVAPRGTARTLLLMAFDSVDHSIKEVLLDMSASNSIGVDVASGYLHVVPPTPNSDKLPIVVRTVVVTGGPPPTAAPTTESAPHRRTEADSRESPPHPVADHPAADAAGPPPAADAAAAAEVASFPAPPNFEATPSKPEVGRESASGQSKPAEASSSSAAQSPFPTAPSPFPIAPPRTGTYAAPAFPMPPSRQ